MKILIVSGFLGAGKTTFIKALAKYSGKKFAVLENEYGAAGIDGDRLNESLADGEVNIWEMAEGCICCSAKGDFAASVLTIANAVDPEYLIVEPTGVGMLGRIVENLQQIEYERIRLLAPITIVDIHSYRRYEQEYTELYENQIQEAGTIIVSKTENSLPSEKDSIREQLHQRNPKATIIVEHYSSLLKEEWLRLLETTYDGEVLDTTGDMQEKLPDSFSMTNVSIDSVEKLIVFLEDTIRGRYGNILRAKGQLLAGKEKVQFDLADSRYCVMGADEIEKGKAVLIGEEIKKEQIRNLFSVKYQMKYKV